MVALTNPKKNIFKKWDRQMKNSKVGNPRGKDW